MGGFKDCARKSQSVDPEIIYLLKHFIMQRFSDLENYSKSFEVFLLLNNYMKHQFELYTIISKSFQDL